MFSCTYASLRSYYMLIHGIKDLAKKYNDGHKLVFDMAFRDEKKSRDELLEQLGPGVYTTPDDSWPGAPRDW
jgi:hypothetical protein